MAIELTDDGTLDTVLRCSECGEEMRYTFTEVGLADDEPNAQKAYDVWVKGCLEDAAADHECTADEDSEPTEPQEGDITTSDDRHFYMHGKLCLELIEGHSSGEYWRAHKGHMSRGATWIDLGRFASVEQAIKAYMVLENYFPNAWTISDHGNAHLMDLTEGGK